MKVLCYSVRLSSLTSISEKAYKAVAFDGSEAIIPKSQVLGQDYDVSKSEAYWISEWILRQKDLQYSGKKEDWDKLKANLVTDPKGFRGLKKSTCDVFRVYHDFDQQTGEVS